MGIPAVVLTIWLILKKHGQSLAVVGVVTPYTSWSNTLLIGAGGALLLVVLSEFGYPPLQGLLGLGGQDLSSYEGIEGNRGLLALYLTVAWTTAGFGEELIFRGFLLGGLARWLGLSRSAWIAAVLISSLLFGLMHVKTGVGGVLTTGLHGAVLAGLYLLSRRSIWAVYIAHGLSNTVSFLSIYTGWYKSLL